MDKATFAEYPFVSHVALFADSADYISCARGIDNESLGSKTIESSCTYLLNACCFFYLCGPLFLFFTFLLMDKFL